jgi:hypothetical protein
MTRNYTIKLTSKLLKGGKSRKARRKTKKRSEKRKGQLTIAQINRRKRDNIRKREQKKRKQKERKDDVDKPESEPETDTESEPDIEPKPESDATDIISEVSQHYQGLLQGIRQIQDVLDSSYNSDNIDLSVSFPVKNIIDISNIISQFPDVDERTEDELKNIIQEFNRLPNPPSTSREALTQEQRKKIIIAGILKRLGIEDDLSEDETEATDNEPREIEPTDNEPREIEPTDNEPRETEPREIEATDTESMNTEPRETEPRETESMDTEPTNTEPRETESTNTEPTDTEPRETESTDTEPTDTEARDTEPTNTELRDTEPTNTEPTRRQQPSIRQLLRRPSESKTPETNPPPTEPETIDISNYDISGETHYTTSTIFQHPILPLRKFIRQNVVPSKDNPPLLTTYNDNPFYSFKTTYPNTTIPVIFSQNRKQLSESEIVVYYSIDPTHFFVEIEYKFKALKEKGQPLKYIMRYTGDTIYISVIRKKPLHYYTIKNNRCYEYDKNGNYKTLYSIDYNLYYIHLNTNIRPELIEFNSTQFPTFLEKRKQYYSLLENKIVGELKVPSIEGYLKDRIFLEQPLILNDINENNKLLFSTFFKDTSIKLIDSYKIYSYKIQEEIPYYPFIFLNSNILVRFIKTNYSNPIYLRMKLSLFTEKELSKKQTTKNVFSLTCKYHRQEFNRILNDLTDDTTITTKDKVIVLRDKDAILKEKEQQRKEKKKRNDKLLLENEKIFKNNLRRLMIDK